MIVTNDGESIPFGVSRKINNKMPDHACVKTYYLKIPLYKQYRSEYDSCEDDIISGIWVKVFLLGIYICRYGIHFSFLHGFER